MLKVQGIGHLGKDAIVNTVNGKNVINFSIASTEKWKDNAGVQKEKTIWLECAYWTDKTNISNYLKKGTQVFVEGNGDVREWTSKEGVHGASIMCKVLNIVLLGSSQGNGSNGAVSQQQAETTASGAPVASDLPF